MNTIKIYGNGIEPCSHFFQIAKNAYPLRAHLDRLSKYRIEVIHPLGDELCAVDCYSDQEAKSFDLGMLAYPVAFHFSYLNLEENRYSHPMTTVCIYTKRLVPKVIKLHREAIEELQETLNYLEQDYAEVMEEQQAKDMAQFDE